MMSNLRYGTIFGRNSSQESSVTSFQSNPRAFSSIFDMHSETSKFLHNLSKLPGRWLNVHWKWIFTSFVRMSNLRILELLFIIFLNLTPGVFKTIYASNPRELCAYIFTYARTFFPQRCLYHSYISPNMSLIQFNPVNTTTSEVWSSPNAQAKGIAWVPFFQKVSQSQTSTFSFYSDTLQRI